jgi:hypothetical protein
LSLFPPDTGELLDEEAFDKRFDAAWATARSRFFKCEARQTYAEPDDPSFQAFARGDFAEARRLVVERVREQQPMYADALARGLTLTRVRVAELPLTPYLSEYEIPSYRASQELGERIFVATTDRLSEPELGDFLLFDSDTVFVHRHDADGKPDGAWLVAATDAAPYVALAERLLSRSRPLDDFLAEQTS